MSPVVQEPLTSTEVLVARLTRAMRTGASPALCFVEVQGLDRWHNSFGFRGTEAMMATVGGALRELHRKPGAVARFDRGSFLVHLDEDTPPVAFAAKALARFEAPLPLAERDVLVNIAIGIATPCHATRDGADLVDVALMGAYEARRRRVGYAYGRAQPNSPEACQITEVALRTAIGSDLIEVHYQPLTSTRTGRPRGAEALVRWRDASGRLVPPDSFIPLAESTGLIGLLGEAVLTKAAGEWSKRFGASGGGITLSVNVSARQLSDPWLADEVIAILEAAGLDAHALELEITEQSVLENLECAARTMKRLGQAGVRFALDDFGTGYSSLSVLAELPFRTVKLDRSLIDGLPDAPRKQAVVRSVVAMAADMGMQVVAEGIETPAQLDSARALGCDMAQGFLLGRPVPALDVKWAGVRAVA